MGCYDYDSLKTHIGHKVVCVAYGTKNNPANIAIECEDCCEVLFDFDRADIGDVFDKTPGWED